jgi:hypothetical protein
MSRFLAAACSAAMLSLSVGCDALSGLLTDVAGLAVGEADTTETVNPLERTTKIKILQTEKVDSGVTEILSAFADFVAFDGSQTVTDFAAIMLDADSVGADSIRDHALVVAALQAGVPVILAEPTAAHNQQLIHELIGVSPVRTPAAVLIDRVPDSVDRNHWAIIEGGGATDDHPYESEAHALADEHYVFAAAVLDYLENGEFDLNQRIEPQGATTTAKPFATAADADNGDSTLAPQAGAQFKHVYQVVTGRSTGVVPTPAFLGGGSTAPFFLRVRDYVGYMQAFTSQAPSHQIFNSWYFYHNNGDNPSDDFAGADCFVAILHQRCSFSVGPNGITSRGAALGYFHDYVTVRNTPFTYPAGDASSLSPAYPTLDETSPTNVNQVTHEESTHGTSVTKTLSFGVSNQGVNAGGSVSTTNSVSFSTSRDIADWGILNLSDPGTSSSGWVFHQQKPCDPYQADWNCMTKHTPTPVPPLSEGANIQDVVTVWSTIGMDPSDPATNTFRLAFTTDAQQSMRLLAYPTFVAPPAVVKRDSMISATLKSSTTYAVELNEAFFSK